MQTLGILLWWVVFTGLMAWGQGWLMPAIKRTDNHTPESDRQKFALHWILGTVWALPAVLLLPFYLHWEPVVIALLIRFICFDVVLNYTEGTTVFAVGESANTDKLLRKIAGVISIPVAYLSALFRLLAFLLLVVFVILKFL